MKKELQRLEKFVNEIPNQLKLIEPIDFQAHTLPGIWSRQELLGHLIDFAAITHQRIINYQIEIENLQEIHFREREWVNLQVYQYLPIEHLIDFWEIYNEHLFMVISKIPEEKFQKSIIFSNQKKISLNNLILDYLNQTENQLNKILSLKTENVVFFG